MHFIAKAVRLLFIGILFCPSLLDAQEQSFIKGSVFHASTKEAVPFATVRIKGTNVGTSTDENGFFQLRLPKSKTDSVTIIISCLGYLTQEREVEITTMQSFALIPEEGLLTEVVYSASRVAQNILRSPVSIEKITSKGIQQSPALTFYDALSSFKGVEAVTSGLTYKQINTRGFNNTGNQRFLQLIDGVDNQGPGLNFSVGNFFGVSDLDVASVEVIPGSASALYGPIAFNGLLQVLTKDPFQYKGLSFAWKNGINHIGENDVQPSFLKDLAIRYAAPVSKRMAFKINASYLKGLDWFAQDYTDIGPGTPLASRGPNNPGRDALNIYGDEVSRTLPGIGLVSRTGYKEIDLMDYEVYSAKLNGSVYYKINDKITVKYQYGLGKGIANYTGSSRYSLRNYSLYNQVLEVKGSSFFWRAYRTAERSGDTYNSRSLAQFINRQWVKDLNGNLVSPAQADATWFLRYASAYNGSVAGVNANNHTTARSFADDGRILPGTSLFNNWKERITHLYGLEGSGVFTQCALWHSEGQYDLSKLLNNKVDLQAGGSIRLYDLNTNGSLFDDKEKKLSMLESGLFVQSAKDLIKQKLRLVASLRYDKNENFAGNFTPRVALLYHPHGTHHFRASYQTGFRNPTTVDLFIKLNVGPITILGGAPENSRGMNVYENSFTAASVASFTAAFNKAIASGSVSFAQALQQTKNELQKATVPYIMPEQSKAFELGYRGKIGKGLLLDINAYYTRYTQFILNTIVQRPQQPVLNADGSVNTAAAEDLLNGRGQAFQLYTNSTGIVSSWGYSLGLDWKKEKGFESGVNLTYASILSNSEPGKIIDFNTPPYSTNIYFGNNHLRQYGFRINWHWQDAFDWYGTLNGNRPGRIKAYNQIDFQLTRRVEKWKSSFKLGGNNILNHRVIQAYGSPAIGAIYYLSYSFGEQ
jgi:iron complex outermembrane receptor protein